jgi:hypothetical protein
MTNRQPSTTRGTVEAGVFLVVVALPLVFTPFTSAPFADAKLVILLGATLLLALSSLKVERTLLIVTSSWILVLALSSALGLDPMWSLYGSPRQATGFLALASSGALLCAATGLGDDIRARIPGWLFWTGVVVSASLILGRFVHVGSSSWNLGNLTSTLGDRIFVGGFVAAATLAATSLRLRKRTYAGLVVVGSGLAISAVRSAWVGTAIGLLWVLWRGWPRWRQVLGVTVPVLIAIGGWTIADRQLPPNQVALSAASAFTELDEGTAVERIPGWQVNIRAWGDRPALGSGLGTGWNGYLRHATADEVAISRRGLTDAHNMLVEMLATSGALGAFALLVLGGTVLVFVLRAPPDRAWAGGVLLAVGVVNAVQPLNIVLTPLMFLAAGLACRRRAEVRSVRIGRWVAVPFAVGLLLGSQRLAASSFERYGSIYGSASALRWSLRVEPRRFGAEVALARHHAVEHNPQDPTPEAEARRLVRRMLDQYGWLPNSRLEAADVLAVLGDTRGARRLVREDLRLFPNDPRALIAAAVLELRAGDNDAAQALARRALAIDDDYKFARSVLRAAETGREVRLEPTERSNPEMQGRQRTAR